MGQHTQHVAFAMLLNFDHVSAKISEDHCSCGGGDYCGAVYDFKAFEERVLHVWQTLWRTSS